MSQYDVAVGLNSTTLDKGAAQLHADPGARAKFFKGTETGTFNKLTYTADWDIQAPPTFDLSPPPADQWAQSIDSSGNHPDAGARPTVNAFQLVMPTFAASYTMGSAQPVSGTTKVVVFATLAIQDSKATFYPASIWLDETQMKGWDKFILNKVILPRILPQAQQMLAGLTIPPLSFSQSGVSIELTPPIAAIQNNQLILAASLKAKQTVDITGVQWPNQPLFLLLSPTLLENAASELAQSQLVNQIFSDNGDYKSVLKYEWEAKVNSVDSITTHADDRTKLSANIGFGFTATLKPLGIGGPCAVTAATKTF
ncbi:hypothetical protein [Paenibacillus sp. HJGM_3]|uniref:hypothetical protein n=1 Tax=Paenibacillus sp. HJGM_3 TaxID=3379816 RepID=UPI00385F99DE